MERSRRTRPPAALVPVVFGLALAGCASGPDSIPLLGPLSAIEGRIVGTVTSGRGAVDRAAVSLAPGGFTTESSASGSYELAAIPPGTYQVRAAAPGFNPAARDVTVLPGRVSGADLALSRASATGSVGGRITDGTVGVAGARVVLSGTNSVQLSGADGTFLFTGVDPGLYSVDVSRPGFVGGSGIARVAASGEARVELALTRRADGALVGRVTDGLRGLASCSRPAAIALFVGGQRAERLVPPADACAASGGVLAVDDRFRFEGLVTGTVILQAAVNGFVAATKVIEIVGGAENNGDIVLTLDGSTSAITGTVFDDTLLPQPQATVELSQGATRRTTVTGAEGRYQLTGLPAGPATLTFVRSELNVGLRNVVLSRGNTVDGSVVLRK
ncbi:MAG: carboxypeptidase regulatory-like domain-containing protein [Candidatus Wallbacteria bacterium]|nr:carboxypeptidase regulatory-like domain-containing protein [Candidatus Wallbacteria bacterium]